MVLYVASVGTDDSVRPNEDNVVFGADRVVRPYTIFPEQLLPANSARLFLP